ncbi:MAG: glycogen synthase GlgA [Gammaproteobacteria bacterium]|nr:glycogen synthase GlgA [Gammaproteobacteria bacterium]MCW8927401.1 glycogen synthase GlgA [Gammaproteobacteria bacterium]MCW8957936.1 glycogen synthase GlgA [Gammaproteobacteria bacterium]MCW8972122.1 glycogen synthase GlgA [Gammaproteobacteria bacterium]MCW8992786.1 glycogen synthase GlgA [Gammaproteobacteria bacterium]
MSRILFASSEAAPLIKTGGLADISGSLPAALKSLRQGVRLVLPAYPQALQRIGKTRQRARLNISGDTVSLLEGRMPDSGVTVWLVDAPQHFDRGGGPYVDAEGNDWPDNAERFTLFCRVVVEIAMGRAGLKWQPEVLHCNDWQTGLVPALLSLERERPASVFSIHNLAYQGRFPYSTFEKLRLPAELWHYSGLEFYGDLSMIKGGLAYADRLTTVSPTYAQEICTPGLGHGLEGLLRYRCRQLTGILNGVDYSVWDPSVDPFIKAHYSAEHPAAKRRNKAALQKRLGLPVDADIPLLGLVSRFVEQKGIDLLLKAAPKLFGNEVQLVMLGSGERELERATKALAQRYPRQVAVCIGYDEELAHQIEAGADLFLMPSRFEPCGLNQLYSLRYGTLPVVHRTGGLADTVVHTDAQSLADGSATGFTFEHATAEELLGAIQQAIACYRKAACRKQVMQNAMAQDFSWKQSARAYLAVYRQAIQDAASG